MNAQSDRTNRIQAIVAREQERASQPLTKQEVGLKNKTQPMTQNKPKRMQNQEEMKVDRSAPNQAP